MFGLVSHGSRRHRRSAQPSVCPTCGHPTSDQRRTLRLTAPTCHVVADDYQAFWGEVCGCRAAAHRC